MILPTELDALRHQGLDPQARDSLAALFSARPVVVTRFLPNGISAQTTDFEWLAWVAPAASLTPQTFIRLYMAGWHQSENLGAVLPVTFTLKLNNVELCHVDVQLPDRAAATDTWEVRAHFGLYNSMTQSKPSGVTTKLYVTSVLSGEFSDGTDNATSSGSSMEDMFLTSATTANGGGVDTTLDVNSPNRFSLTSHINVAAIDEALYGLVGYIEAL